MNVESQILNVPIEDIIPNRFQPRRNFDDRALNELANSIKEHGIIQPLVLRTLGDKYEIIAGERRYKAAKIAGLITVPAIISNLDDLTSAEVAIVENIQRKNLSSIEEAKSYKALLDKGYLTQEELAKKMGLSQSAISNKLRLLTLSPSVQNALMEGKISERHARSLLQIESLEEQEKWLNKIIDERITVKELENQIKLKHSKNKIETEIPIVQNTIDKIQNNMFEKETAIPNKFFNFLEDEEANMNIVETINNNFEEDIELLDFLAPQSLVEIKKEIDINKAQNLINETINNLIKDNYQVNLEKEEENNQIKFIITIKKS